MASQLNFCFLFFAIFTLTNSFKLVHNTDDSIASVYSNHNGERIVDKSVQCGNEILNGDSGTIRYKPDYPLAPNERCVWLVRVANASAYSVAVFSLGIPEASSEHKLSITSFTAYGPAENTFINKTGLSKISGSILVVTLHSGNASNTGNPTGFSLSYTTHLEGAPLISSSFLDMFWDATSERRLEFGGGSSRDPHALTFKFFNFGGEPYNPHNKMKISYARGEGWTSSSILEGYTYSPVSGWSLTTRFGSDENFRVLESSNLLLIMTRSTNPEINVFHYFLANFFCNNSQI